MKKKKIKVGVIGYGGAFNMGRHHLTEMKAAGMEPVAVAEVDNARAVIAQQDFPGIQIFNDVGQMLTQSDVELVTLITPHNTHAALGLQCLKAGRHVICEKPMAITTVECDAMIAAARKKKLLLSTYHNRHWDGWILRAVDQVKKKKTIGEVHRIDLRMGRRGQPGDWWRSSKSISGGILYDWGVHLLEYAFQIIDSEITEVSGFAREGFWGPQTKWKADAIEDEGAAVIRFKNGAWINLCISQLDANPEPGFVEIHGTKGNYVIEWNQYRHYHIENGVATTEQGPHPQNQSQKFYDNIAAHLTRGERLVITPEWSRRPIHVLDLAVRSAKAGRALPAKYG
ncbi:MAG: Gfo/Idh/MocA family protein [Terrimicrobiaceae bacterium]